MHAVVDRSAKTLYIFFGIAGLVGLLIGTSLHYVSGFFESLLDLEGQSREQKERMLDNYRAGNVDQRRKTERPLKRKHRGREVKNHCVAFRDGHANWDLSKQERGRGKNGSRPTTIIEEDDNWEDGI